MNVAHAYAEFLARRGVTHAFLVQGAANNDLIYAIADTPGIEYVCTMHEQAAGFAAEGWAKVQPSAVSRQPSGLIPGVVIATSGPGGQNLLTPLANFHYDSVPGIFITGNVNSRFLSPDPRVRQLGFQECRIGEMAEPCCKWWRQPRTPDEALWALEMAWQFALEGRPGPVWLDIPIDVQRAECDPPTTPAVSRQPSAVSESGLDFRKLTRWLGWLAAAERPALLVGGGARGTNVKALALALGAPAFPTWNALDVISSDFANYGGRVGTYGGPGRNFGIQNCDVLLAIGSRVSGRITGGVVDSFARRARKLIVDIDDGLRILLEHYDDSHPIMQSGDEIMTCDAGVFVSAALAALRGDSVATEG